MKRSTIIGFAFLLAIVALLVWYYGFQGHVFIDPFIPSTYLNAIFTITAIIVVYQVVVKITRFGIIRSKGTVGESRMVKSVVKFLFIFLVLVVVVFLWVPLGAVGDIFALFGGSMLGWSLQAPISGIAAWLMVSIVRPFRVGDRVQLPQHNLVGDVVSISPLYTTLNQVGGSVGSEEPADRTILVPNAMLFSSLVINYTPKHQDELLQSHSAKINAEAPRAYMLDEFVLRISFDSDWDDAERILLEAARNATADIIKETGQQPYVRGDYGDWYGPFLRLRFLTNATQRPKIIYEISKYVFKAVQASDKVDMAIPYIYSFRKSAQMSGHPANGNDESKPPRKKEIEPKETGN
jgi:small-conductance mechanosensitive channel